MDVFEKAIGQDFVSLTRTLAYLPMAAAIADAEGNIRWANRNYADSMGNRFAVEEPDLDVLHQVIASGQPWRDEAVTHRDDGTSLSTLRTVTPIRDSNGATQAALLLRDGGSARDSSILSDDKASEFYREVFEGALEGIYRATPEGRTLAANPAFARMLGYSSVQEVITAITDSANQLWVSPKDRSHFRGLVESFDTVQGYEVRFKRKDGTPIWVSLNARRLRGGNGRTRSYDCFIEDITERKRMEEALRESEAQLREAESLAHLGSASWDVANDATIWSRELYNIAGLDPSQPAPRHAERAAIYTPESWARLKQAVERAIATAEPYDLELDVVRPDGTVRRAHGRGAAIRDEAGQVVRLHGTLQDITERKVAEQERVKLQDLLRQSQKLESVGRLAGGVAHDFNNLLTIINGYSELVLKQLPPSHPFREYIEDIHKAGQRGAALTRQLLAFSRKDLIKPAPVDLNLLISEQQAMLGRLIGEDVEIVLELSNTPGLILADGNQIHQMLLNLIANAREAMPKGGRLTLRTETAELDDTAALASGATPGVYVVLTVTDTGEGMSEEVMQHLFEPFFTTKDPGKGTGLGLSTVYGIVQQGGGWLDVRSKPGEGATFRIGFPRTAEAKISDEALAPVHRSLFGSETILVVEDQEEVRRFAVDVLRQYGYQVLEAGNGEEALALVERHQGQVHMMLSDAVMPGISGPELADQMSRLYPKMGVLLMSGYPGEVVDARRLLGARLDYVSKPFSSVELGLRVREVLGRKPCLGNILVADDEEAIRTLFASVLVGAGYDVVTTSDGRQAQLLLESQDFDLLITDLAMPRQEGVETIRAVRKIHPKLKIIAISGAFGKTLLRVASLLGASATLMKPVSANELISTVKSVIGPDVT